MNYTRTPTQGEHPKWRSLPAKTPAAAVLRWCIMNQSMAASATGFAPSTTRSAELPASTCSARRTTTGSNCSPFRSPTNNAQNRGFRFSSTMAEVSFSLAALLKCLPTTRLASTTGALTFTSEATTPLAGEVSPPLRTWLPMRRVKPAHTTRPSAQRRFATNTCDSGAP